MKLSLVKMAPLLMNKLTYMGNGQGKVRLDQLSLEMGLSADDALELIEEIFPIGSGVEIHHQEDGSYIEIDSKSIQYMLPLSTSEWFSLNNLLANVGFDKLKEDQNLRSIKNRVTENTPIKAVMDLLKQLESFENDLSSKQQTFIDILDQAVMHESMVCLEMADKKMIKTFPRKVLHLEGNLSLVAEEASEHCLMIVGVGEIANVEIIETTSTSRASHFEIEEFIAAIRLMNEKETRLILKIHDPQSVNLFPDHHFLGKPCMITNPVGDLIWAAYVEPCEALFEWVLSLGKNVEVLDPSSFKEEYLQYCEEKLRKIA